MNEVAALRPKGHAQFVRLFRQEGAAGALLENVPEAVRPAVCDGEGRKREILGLKEHPGLDLTEVQRHGRLISAQDHAVQQIVDAVEGGAPTVDLQGFDRLPAQESAQQPT